MDILIRLSGWAIQYRDYLYIYIYSVQMTYRFQEIDNTCRRDVWIDTMGLDVPIESRLKDQGIRQEEEIEIVS